MKRYLLVGAFIAAFVATFSLLESRTVVLRTLTSSARTEAAPSTAEVRFVGDLMFDRYIRTAIGRDVPVLEGVAPLLTDADFAVGNLEGPITDRPSLSQGTKVGELTNMRFTFAPEVRDLLLAHNFGLVSIGNNHIRDMDDAGVQSTTRYLEGAGIAYVGDPSGRSPEPVVKEIDGVRVAFVSYSDFIGGDAARARDAVARADADATVVLAHWGNEYESEPPPRVRELAHSLVASGADLIIGSHPHVIGAVEDIGGARVYYSLGNFVFDQYWEPSVRCGLSVKATFTKDAGGTTIQYAETRVGMQRDGRTVLGCS